MYMQSQMEPAFMSIRTKIEDRLKDLALMKYLDLESNQNMTDLAMRLCNINALSPTEFRAIGYLMDIHDKVLHAKRINPDVIKEATEIGERVVRIIDNRLTTV